MFTKMPAAEARTEIMTITPELATQWLEGNTHNRQVKPKVVQVYLEDMREGRWLLNGSTIVFDETGRLLDGQHRLWACIESDRPFPSIVVRGLSEAAFMTIDQGQKRTPADHLYVAGHRVSQGNQPRLAASAQLVWRYRHNDWAKSKLQADDLVSTLDQEPGLAYWVGTCASVGGRLKGWASVTAAVLYLGSRGRPQKAEEFSERFKTGADLGPGSPVLVLRNRALNQSSRGLDRQEKMWMVTSCWNHFAQDRPMHKFGAWKSADFPRIVGA